MGRPNVVALTLLLVLPAALALISMPGATASPYHLMENNNLNLGTDEPIYRDRKLAQAFTASDGYVYTRATLFVQDVGADDVLNVTLRPMDTVVGGPSNIILARGSNNSGPYDWVNFDMSPRVTLTKGVIYWIVAENGAATSTDGYTWKNPRTNAYAGGTLAVWTSLNGWVLDANGYDLSFRNYGFIEARITVAKTNNKPRPQPGDTIRYTIYINNTGTEPAQRVWVNDSLPTSVSYKTDNASTSGGIRTGDYNWTFSNVVQGTHIFFIDVAVKDAVAPGTVALNSVTVDYTNSSGVQQPRSSGTSSSIIGLKTKTLYLHEAGDLDTLDTKPPTSTEDCNGAGAPCDYDLDGVRGVTIKRGELHDWLLHPAVAGNFSLYTQISSVLWLDDKGAGDSDKITIGFYVNSALNLIDSRTYSFTPDKIQGFQGFTFTDPSLNTTLAPGDALLLRVSVPSNAPDDLQVAYDTTAISLQKAYQSRLLVETPTYINIPSLRTWDVRGPTSNFVVAENLTLRVTVADPLGSYDIVNTGTKFDIVDPNSRIVASGVTMNLNSTDPGNPSAWKTFIYTFTIPESSTQGTYTLRVTGTESNTVTWTVSTTFDVRAPVLQVAKLAAAPFARPGDIIRYTLYYNNTGLEKASKVWVNDTLPPEVTYTSDDAQAFRTGVGRWVFLNVSPGPHALRLNVTVNAGVAGTTKVLNTFVATYVDQKGYLRGPKAANNTVTINGPYIIVAKIVSSTFVNRGENVSYTIYFNNTGNEAAPRVWVNDTLPPGVDFVSDDASSLTGIFDSLWYQPTIHHYNFTNVAPGNHQFQLIVMPQPSLPGGALITNRVTVEYRNGANQSLPPSASSASSYVVGPRVLPSLTYSANRNPGGPVVMDLHFDNTGLGVSPAYGVYFVLTVGPDIALVNWSGGGQYLQAQGKLQWFEPVIFDGASGDLFVNATVRVGVPDGHRVDLIFRTNFTDELGNAMTPLWSNGTFNVTAPVVGFTLGVDKATAISGDLMNYTLYFNNSGSGEAANLWINSSLNSFTAVMTVTLNTLGDITVLVPRLGNRVTVHVANVARGSYKAVVQVEIRAGLRDGLAVNNTFRLDSSDGNGNPVPAMFVNHTAIVRAPKLELSLSVDRSQVLPGGLINATLTLRNAGNASARHAWVNLTLPHELLLEAQESSALWTSSGATQSWYFPAMAPGGSGTIRITLRVRFDTPAGSAIPLQMALVFTDSFGLAQAQGVSNTETISIVSTPTNLPWFYLLGLLAVVPAVVYHRRRIPAIQEAFVVYKDGTLLTHHSRTKTSDKDEDVLMAMFTAIQEFIKESFSYGTTRELKGMNLGEYSVEIQRGEYVYLAVIFSGKATPGLHRKLEALVDSMEATHGKYLDGWAGNMDQVSGIGAIAARLFPRKYRGGPDVAP